ncbi:hypothetical protein HT136_07385 [Novosphingobium profundi]|uniref:hypothetical protein n=1 Tax=Novosphingobium profundi TaxID=1774954 RepID=UPI001BD99ABB|nr:hypothetical protein [Novosphingobium profundi]MBT0668186.1 hypothetical protein [Novosphingobium profundi]
MQEPTVTGPKGAIVPRSAEAIAEAAARRGVVLPAACREGVAQNMALLEAHLWSMRGYEASDRTGGEGA